MIANVLLCWSGGKDSAMALYELKSGAQHRVETLLTILSAEENRTFMHNLPGELLAEQAKSLSLPVETVYVKKSASAGQYQRAMKNVLTAHIKRGITHVAFGDVFLEDIRQYRQQRLAELGVKALFPIWKRNTAELMREFISLGFRAIVTCVDTERLDKSFAGRFIDEKFLADLPLDIDPCGENGEYHSFVFDGPIFTESVRFGIGRKAMRENRFCCCELDTC